MDPDDELCLCFHVTRRKVVNFLRVERPQKAAQLSDCFGAGTGCGWCRPYLKQLFEAAKSENLEDIVLSGADHYADRRTQYVQAGKGICPPGATPIGPEQI